MFRFPSQSIAKLPACQIVRSAERSVLGVVGYVAGSTVPSGTQQPTCRQKPAEQDPEVNKITFTKAKIHPTKKILLTTLLSLQVEECELFELSLTR